MSALLTANAREMNVDEDEGEGVYLSDLLQPKDSDTESDGFSFFNKATSAELFAQGVDLEAEGKLRQAKRKFKVLLKRAPHSTQAAEAQQHLAGIYLKQEKYTKAKTAYEYLLENYGAQADYDSVLASLMDLAEKQEEAHHFKWLFGGYTSPENAIPTLELIVRYGPATSFAPESQYRIARTYQKNEDLYEAVSAYDVVLFRYPDSTVTEAAAMGKADCLRQISQKQENNETAREEAWVACKVFLSMFPESEQRATVEKWAVDLYLARAQDMYNKAVFYETKAYKPEAAKVYYEMVTNKFSESVLADKAKAKLEALKKKESTDDA